LVALNSGESAATIELKDPELAGARWGVVSLPGVPDPSEFSIDESGRASITLPPRSGVLLRRL
jgi:hypothetical protein